MIQIRLLKWKKKMQKEVEKKLKEMQIKLIFKVDKNKATVS